MAQFICHQLLKYDAFGSIEKGVYINAQAKIIPAIRRLYTKNVYIRPLAKWLARKEIAALRRLEPLQLQGQLPQILDSSKHAHIRSYLEGDPIYEVTTLPENYFLLCKKLLRQMRKCGVCNNDLAKEANWLITPLGLPALMDFQLALFFRNSRNRFFLSFCYDDLRHLLKHQRKYHHIGPKEEKILKKKSLVSRLWRVTGKKLYLVVTRKLLGWQERTGPSERPI